MNALLDENKACKGKNDYTERYDSVYPDVKKKVIISLIIMSILAMVFVFMYDFIFDSTPISSDKIADRIANQRLDTDLLISRGLGYNIYMFFIALLNQILYAALAGGIVLHSRNIKEIGYFNGIENDGLNLVKSYLLVSVLLFLVKLVTFIPIFLLSLGIAILVISTSSIVVFSISMIILTIIAVLVESVVSFIFEPMKLEIVLTRGGDISIMEIFRKYKDKAKEGDNVREYLKINIFFALKILLGVILTIFTIVLFTAINLPFLSLFSFIFLVVYLVNKIASYTVMINIYLSEVVMNDFLLNEYPQVDQTVYKKEAII